MKVRNKSNLIHKEESIVNAVTSLLTHSAFTDE